MMQLSRRTHVKLIRLKQIPVSAAIYLLLTAYSALRCVALSVAGVMVARMTVIHRLKATRAKRIRTATAAKRAAVVTTAVGVAPSARGVCLHNGFLMPPVMPHNQHRLTVVLDLDETLVCTYKAEGVPGWLRRHPATAAASFPLSYCADDGSPAQVVVFERPGLREFLQRASQFAELVLFTAGMPMYAEPVAARLDPGGKLFAARLYREATVLTAWRDNVKDLSMLGRDLSRTVIVDNNPYAFLLQPSNGVPCLPYHGNPADGHLLAVILPLLQTLAELSDVRPILSSRFRMESWFEGKGVRVTSS